MRKKNKVLLLCGILAGVSCSAGVALTKNVVSADSLKTTVVLEDTYLTIGNDTDQHAVELKVGDETHTIRYGLQDGASVRYADPSGIRFSSFLAQADYEALLSAYSNVEFGVIVKQGEVEDVSTFVIGGEGVGKIEAEKMSIYTKATEGASDGVLRFCSVINSIPTTEYETQVSTRGYVQVVVDGTTYTQYTDYSIDENCRSIDYVANCVFQDDTVQLTNSQRGYLEEIVTQGQESVAITLDATRDLNEQLSLALDKEVVKSFDSSLIETAKDAKSEALTNVWMDEINQLSGNQTARTKAISVYTNDGAVYKVNALVASKIIYTAEQLVNWQIYTNKGEEVTAEDANATYGKWVYDGYIVLGANIDLTGQTISTLMKTASGQTEIYGFQGTFDGNGYAISGGEYDKGGLFGTLGTNGVLKNVAIMDSTYCAYDWVSGEIGGCVVANNVYGTVENCLIETQGVIKETRAGLGRAIASDGIRGVVKNTVVYSDTPNNSMALAEYVISCATAENLYIFTDATGDNHLSYKNYSFSSGYTVYGLNDSLPEGIEEVLTSEYWDFTGTRAAFDTKADQSQIINTVNVEYELYSGLDSASEYAKIENASALSIDIGMDGTFTCLKNQESYEAVDGKITIADVASNFELGKNTFTLFGNGKEIQVNLWVYTAIITEADELVNWHNYTTRENETDGNSYKKWSYGGYFALGADIDLTGKTITTKLDSEDATYGFQGTFDGRGYTITGGLYSEGGLFGAIATNGVVKNVAFVGGTLDAWEGWDSSKLFASVFADYMGGTIDNCLVKVSRTNAVSTKYEQNNVFGCTLTGRISNTVVYVDGCSGNPNYAIARNVNIDASFSNFYSFVQSGWAGGRMWVGGGNGLPEGVYDNAYDTKVSDTNMAETLTNEYWVIDADNNTVALQEKTAN